MPLIRRLFASYLATAVIVVTSTVGCAESRRSLNSSERALVAEKYDPALGATPEHAKSIRDLVKNQRLNAARSELPKIVRAAKERKDHGEWAWGLIEAAQIDSALSGPRSALQTLTSEPWPENLVSRTALALAKATFLAKLAATGRKEYSQEGLAISSGQDQPFTREDVLLSLQDTWSHRTELGKEGSSRLSALLEPGNYPKGIRDTLRDFVSYQSAKVLVDHQLWTPEEMAGVWTFDLAAIANAEPEALAHAQPTDVAVHPLRRAVAVLADLEAWHRSRGAHDAALEARLQRLRILRDESGNETRRAAIREALRALVTRHRDVHWATKGYAELAEQLYRDIPEDPSQALELARQGERLLPSSIGSQQCRRLAWQITRSSFEACALPIGAPGSPSIRITYQNLRTLHAYAYPSDLAKGAEAAERIAQSGRMPNMNDVLSAGRRSWPSYAWTVSLPATPDHRMHESSITPPLKKPGFYWVALSPHLVFVNEWGYHQGGGVMLSDLNLQTRQDPKGELTATALSWSSGQPLAGISVILYQAKLPKVTGKQGASIALNLSGDHRPPCARLTGVTDAAGKVKFALSEEMAGMRLLIARSGEQWAVEMGNYNPSRLDSRADRSGRWPKTLIATDRAIYRPGQTVYWKTFALQRNGKGGDIKTQPGRKLAMSLLNSKQGAIASQSVATNQHGSASGHFRLPLVGLRGQAWIATDDGPPATVKIEEYRRPTFDVSLEAPRVRSLTAPFSLMGKALLTYGRPVSKGTVAWELRREKAMMPGTDGSWIVAAGRTSLAADGTFSLPFDPRNDVAGEGTAGDRLYTLNAKVVSFSGETRTASRPFYLGSPSVTATLEANAGFFVPGGHAQFRAQRTDLDGRALPGSGTWQVLELRQPASPPRVDLELSSDRIRQGVLQRLSYDAAAVMHAWPDGREVRSGSVRHGAEGRAEIDAGLLPPGAYRIRYTSADSFGSRYETAREFIVAATHPSLALSSALFIDKATASVGSSLHVLVASGHPDQSVRLERYRDQELVDERVFKPSQLRGPIELPVTEADRGGFYLVLHTIRDHRELVSMKRVDVPWDKMLSVSLSGAKAVLPPGSQQTWSAHVHGRDGTPVHQAEVLATMVDRSLDAFGHHEPPDFAAELPVDLSYPHLAYQGSMMGMPELSMFSESGHDLFSPQPPAELTIVPDQVRSDNSYVGEWGWLNTPLGAAARPGSLGQGALGSGADTQRARIPDSEPPIETQVRRNFSETSFFLPHLVTDRNGKANFAFTVPDSVTGWNVNLLALTPDFRSGKFNKVVQSRRDLMVHLTVPRFLREGDEARLTAEIDNTTTRTIDGRLSITVRDSTSGKDLGTAFGLRPRAYAVSLQPGESAAIPVAIRVPKSLGQVTFSVTGRSGALSDGEERMLPILPARLHLAEGRSAILANPGRIALSFDDAPPDPTRTSQRVVLTVHPNLLTSLLTALPGLEPKSIENCDDLIGRLLSTALLGRLLEQDAGLRLAAQRAAKRKSLYQPIEADANRSMLLEETPWLAESRGGGSGIQLLDLKTAQQVREEVVSELASRQSNGGFAWFPGDKISRRATLRVLEGLAEASHAGTSGVNPMLQKGLESLGQNFRTDPTFWKENGDAVIQLAYICSSASNQLRQAAHVDDELMQAVLDEGYKQWKQAPPDLASRLALALHRSRRTAEAQQVWESVMDLMVGTPARGPALPMQSPNRRLLETVAGPASVLRTQLELNPSDARADRLAERLALQMELAQQRSARVSVEGIVALAEYLRQRHINTAPHAITVDYASVQRQASPGADTLIGRQQFSFKLDGPSAPRPLGVSQTVRGTTLATATWHFDTDRASSGSNWPGSGLTRTYSVMQGEGVHRAWVPLQPGRELRVGDEVRARLEFKVPFPLGQVCVRDPRPAGLEPVDASSGQRWFEDGEAFQEVRDNQTSFFFGRLNERPHVIYYRMRAAMSGTFHAAPATLEGLAAPEFRAYSSSAQLRIMR